MKKGFTLIELLVVVLIIGILSSVALPQYQRAVKKARAAEAWTNLKTLSTAVNEWCLANPGTHNTFNMDDLSISLPRGNGKFDYSFEYGISAGSRFYPCPPYGHVFRATNRTDGYILLLSPEGNRACAPTTDRTGTVASTQICKDLGFKNPAGKSCQSDIDCYTE